MSRVHVIRTSLNRRPAPPAFLPFRSGSHCPSQSTTPVSTLPFALWAGGGDDGDWSAPTTLRVAGPGPPPSPTPRRSLRSLRTGLPPPNGRGSPRSDLRHPGPLGVVASQCPTLPGNVVTHVCAPIVTHRRLQPLSVANVCMQAANPVVTV